MVIFYIFLFSTWGLGLFSWVLGLGHLLTKWEIESKEKTLEIDQKRLLFEKFNSATSTRLGVGIGPGQQSIPNKDLIPDKIKELMKSSPDHPEVEEIDSSDQILGVRFEAKNYPPGFDDVDDEE
jgi:hypothetical protein